MLTEVEREHLFLLGLGRLPDVRFRQPACVGARLQRILDAMVCSAALIRTVSWDVVAWNRAAAVMLTDYGQLPPAERNILRLIFIDPHTRATNRDWEGVARAIVGVFRADAARAGASASVAPLVAELQQRSPDFARIWDEGDVRGDAEGTKHLRHPLLGEIAVEYSSFAVDGRPDLTMIVYNPVDGAAVARLRQLAEAAA